ncbi:MAG: FkbM family methyltransferase [Magnetococcales bacterium]|nr:FkbM family methyltransferase [Magnetococcales bacterium]
MFNTAYRLVRKVMWNLCHRGAADDLLPGATENSTIIHSSMGDPFLVDQRNHIDRGLLKRGGYETATVEKFLARTRDLGCTLFLDIGANIGIYTLPLAKRGGVTVIAFEPDPRNANQLAANLFLNDLSDTVSVERLALAAESGEATFHVDRHPEQMNTGSGGFTAAEEHFKPITVSVASGDSHPRLRSLKEKTIAIKIDVEGHEEAVLNGMKNVLANNRIFLQVEIFDDRFETVSAQLEAMGLRPMGKPDARKKNYWFSNVTK